MTKRGVAFSFANFGSAVRNNNGSVMTSVSNGVTTVQIDGAEYRGRRVEIRESGVFVDGKEVAPLDKNSWAHHVHVVFKEPVASIEGTFATLTAEKDVGSVHTSSGDVTVKGGVAGNVATQSGDVDVGGAVGGSVSTMSGDVDLGGTVGGSVSTMSGSIKRRKQ